MNASFQPRRPGRGKIARLPLQTRERLNRVLQNNYPGPAILLWLNNLPETKTVLDAQFHSAPITKQNLSLWRRGGYQDWLLHREVVAQIAELARLQSNPAQSNQNLARPT